MKIENTNYFMEPGDKIEVRVLHPIGQEPFATVQIGGSATFYFHEPEMGVLTDLILQVPRARFLLEQELAAHAAAGGPVV